MNTSIINTPISLDLYGFAGTALNRNWAKTGFGLMNKMWQRIKQNSLNNKGLNVWVYEDNNSMFAGVELESPPQTDTGLEHKKITLAKYAYYKHIGPYSQIASAGSKALNEIASRGLDNCVPYIEIYGHWTADETKLETELLWCLK